MSDFQTYLQLGFQHITDLNGYDHILFVVALCAIYQLRDWRRILVLVTAFTLGHSLTLALATLQVIQYRTAVVEFLIPVTILCTAVSNFFWKDKGRQLVTPRIRYTMALLFGLIHGMGFSNYLRSLLGHEATIVLPLFSFNLGLELGQLVIVTVILGLTWIVVDLGKAPRRDWTLILSGAVAGIALLLIKESDLIQDWLGNGA